jgi:tetratricopeptide (TPR) repeat protein
VSAYNLLGIAYAQQGRTEEALQDFNWAIAHSPVPSAQHYANASQALMILGRFDEAKKMIDEWRQKGSLTPSQSESRYRIAFIEKDTATMDKLAREMPADDVFWLRFQMQLAFLRGDSGTLRSLGETLVNQASRANRKGNVADQLAWHAALEALLGDYALARKLCGLAEEAGNDSASGLWACAMAQGEAGNVTEAEALAAKLDQQFPEDTYQQKIGLPMDRSIIERERGNAVKAVALLVPVTQYPNGAVSYQRAQAYLAAGEYGEAIADFKTVISHRGWPQWEIYSPLAQLGLARAYARQGDTDLSRKAYDDFFTTWKDADPGIPILVQAKAEYKKLTATASAAASASVKNQ